MNELKRRNIENEEIQNSSRCHRFQGISLKWDSLFHQPWSCPKCEPLSLSRNMIAASAC